MASVTTLIFGSYVSGWPARTSLAVSAARARTP